MSKYSVALPLLIYFIYKRQWKIIGIVFLVQLAGIITNSVLSRSSILSIVENYYQIMRQHLNSPGNHLAELFSQDSTWRLLAPILLTAAAFGILAWLLARERKFSKRPEHQQFLDLQLLTALSLWTLLVAYHRAYDGTLVILFIAMIIYGLFQPAIWKLSSNQKAALLIFILFASAMLIVPYEQISSFLPWDITDSLLDVIASGVVITLVAMLAATFWLYFKSIPADPKNLS